MVIKLLSVLIKWSARLKFWFKKLAPKPCSVVKTGFGMEHYYHTVCHPAWQYALVLVVCLTNILYCNKDFLLANIKVFKMIIICIILQCIKSGFTYEIMAFARCYFPLKSRFLWSYLFRHFSFQPFFCFDFISYF